MTSDIQVCLVSDQLLPNLISALTERPREIWLIATNAMRENGKADRLRGMLESENFAVKIHEAIPNTGIDKIQEAALKVAEAIGNATVTLNATGGTKLMAMAFVEIFRELLLPSQLRIIYTDTERGVLETLFPTKQPAQKLTNVLDIPAYLTAQGMIYRKATSSDDDWVKEAEARKALTKYLAQQAEPLASLFGAISRLINMAVDDDWLVKPEQHFDTMPYGAWREALTKTQNANLITWDEGQQIKIQDIAAARYLGGGWLEEYAWHIARDCGIAHVACNVEGTWEGTAKRDAPRNEFDLLAVHNNRMLVVECKTLRLDQADEKGQGIVAKLESLGRNAGGLFGQMLLLSARPVEPTIRNRCRSLKIPLLEGAELKQLRECLLEWKDTGRITL